MDVARGASLIKALLRTRFFLAGSSAALFRPAEVAFASARGRLARVFFGALAFGHGGAPLESVTLLDEEVGSALLSSIELETSSGKTRAGGVSGEASSPDNLTGA